MVAVEGFYSLIEFIDAFLKMNKQILVESYFALGLYKDYRSDGL